jgi:hypothetical protein
VIPRTLAAVFALEAMVLGAVATLALDLRAHYHVEDLGGVNVWGYRGPVMNRKGPREIRVAMAGGDFAFGWGVAAAETLPYFVRQQVALDVDRGQAVVSVTAVNVAARAMDVRDYASWIDRFAYLQPDVVCVLPDPEPRPPNEGRFLPDRGSWFFDAFGYSPILPLVVQEKGALLHSRALQAAGDLLERLDPPARPRALPPSNAPDAIGAAVTAALRAARIGVVLVLPPSRTWRGAIDASDRRLRVVDLNEVPSMHDPALRLDGYSLSVAGHSRAADAVAPAAIDLIHAAGVVAR